MLDRLFIYGTLHPDRAPQQISAAARQLIPAGRGTIRARIYDFGEYPGVILDDSASPIPGEIFIVPDTRTLALLDGYEDFRPGDPAASLFLRTQAVVTLDEGSQLECWVYVWNEVRGLSASNETPDGLVAWDSKRGDCCGGE
jgi:gamma-glutamylcyclotransferase (GGCT)/AIG2-like uncharacterized protein YtfP